ncbi:MAG TPA: 3-deoxy-manno-octulosonate cytidylyltransferase [Thermoanaerobaculia bacterium]|jgi:3-deoxy-manno-octulosonate cytidylyltransferase (CMP-KDO synthetase)|nr:3-deoxy-manno-octulosonate cytidylyltransferase [Thermoanaerobaculia bacterium]
MKAVIVIPARWASTRFPGKPMAMISGVSLIQRVYERASKSERADAVYVATDDDRIAEHVVRFGGRAVQPEGAFATGTDRIAAALPLFDEIYDQVINVQGDEPLIDVRSIDDVIAALDLPDVDMVTLACPIDSEDEYQSRDVVKVVTDLTGNALYFSRAPIPFGSRTLARRHIGLYGYQSGVLRALAETAPSPLEAAESLEQLRALQNNFNIRVLHSDMPHLGVDRPEDIERVERELARLAR